MLQINKTAKAYRKQCNCLPGCTKIEYNADIDRVKYDLKVIQKDILYDEEDEAG